MSGDNLGGDAVLRCIVPEDIPDIVEMQARVWQDHFRRERNMEMPVMRRSRKNIEYYLEKEPGGCFVMLRGGRVAASIFSHVWGKVGWFGPLEVAPEWQGQGTGGALVRRAVDYLASRGCTTIGCETMASSARNIAFYRKLGFRERGLSSVLFKPLAPAMPGKGETNTRNMQPGDIPAARELWHEIHAGLDYTAELEQTWKHDLGRVLIDDHGAHAVLHTYEMFEESQNAIIKMLAAGPGMDEDVMKLLEACEHAAAAAGRTGMFIRTYDPTPPDIGLLFEAGYMLQSVSVRLLLTGEDETGDCHHISSWSG